MILQAKNISKRYGDYQPKSLRLWLFCLTKTTSCASGSEKLLAMYQKSPPKVLY